MTLHHNDNIQKPPSTRRAQDKCDEKSTGSTPPRTSRIQAPSHIPRLHSQPSSALDVTVLRDMRVSQSEPLSALLLFSTGSKMLGSGTKMTNSRLHPDDAAQRQQRADREVLEEHLENADDDLVVLQCTARQERQQRGTVIIGNPVRRDFEQKTTHHVEFSLVLH